MQKSYIKNYIKIYLWQGVALVLRFISMFVILPFLTKQPGIYGIYAICTSATIFFGHADLGFLRSAQKYASEYFGKGDKEMEYRHVGFGIFVLLIITSLLSLLFLYFSFDPSTIIKGLETKKELSVAKSLLLILALMAPITVFQRLANIFFDVRLQGFKTQRISLFSSLITILSSFYFFKDENYQIVSYFLFSQIIYLLVVIISFYLLHKTYQIKFFNIIKYIRFDTGIYKEAKGLAYSGLYIVLFWILYYELDQIVIGKYLGAEQVAIYSIAFAFISFFRSIFGILFSPFTFRSNHFIGMADDKGLKEFCMNVLVITTPIILFITIAFYIVLDNFILTWVGSDYISSISTAKYLILVFTLSPISYLMSIILTAKVKIKELYIIATIQPFVYWVGVYFTYSMLGLVSFGIFKLLATLIANVYLLILFKKFIELPYIILFKKIIYPLVLPLIFLIGTLFLATLFLPMEKSKINLFIVLITTLASIFFSMIILYFTSPFFQRIINSYLPSDNRYLNKIIS